MSFDPDNYLKDKEAPIEATITEKIKTACTDVIVEPKKPKKAKKKSRVPITKTGGKEWQIWLCGNHYYVLRDAELHERLNKQSAELHFHQLNFSDDLDFKSVVNIRLKEVLHKIDFFKPTGIAYDEDMQTITVTRNPSEEWNVEGEIDADIIDEYTTKIMDNKLQDLITLIIGCIHYDEEKLNKLLITGISNKGKSELLKKLEFATLTASEFLKALIKTDQGISVQISNQIMKSGLILADDVYGSLPLELKNVTDEFLIKVMRVGAILHPSKFLAMTSTHNSVIELMNDELKNRVMHLHIGNDFTFDHSQLQKDNKRVYRDHTERYLKGLVLQAIKTPPSVAEFQEVQDRYKITGTNMRDEYIEEVIRSIREVASNRDGTKALNYRFYEGKHYIEKKMPLKTIIKENFKAIFPTQVGVDNAGEIVQLNTFFELGDRKKINGTNFYEVKNLFPPFSEPPHTP